MKKFELEKLAKIYDKDMLLSMYKEHTKEYIFKKLGLSKVCLDRLFEYYGIVSRSRKENASIKLKDAPTIGNKGLRYYNDGVEQKMFEEGNQPTGWAMGGLKYSKEKTEIMLSKRGYRSPMQNPNTVENYKTAFKNKYGVENPMQVYEIFCKNQNGGRTSKSEDDYYKYLLTLYAEEDIMRQYYDVDRYPYHCDFYIKSKDLFIEYQGYWTHGHKPYDENDVECKKLVETWKQKSGDLYRQAVINYTVTDVEKRKTAQRNCLNYLEIFNF